MLLLWLVATAVNFDKAVHIDDTAYLFVTRQVRSEPLHPYDGSLNWQDEARPTYRISQPPLLFYVLAGAFAVFGESERVAHAVVAAFSLLAIACFARLLRLLAPRYVVLASALFVLGPAFIPSQNVMLDVPVLSLWLLFFVLLLGPGGQRRRAARDVAAGVVAGLACLTKYVSAVLLAIFVLVAVLRRGRRSLWIAAVPVLVVFVWSIASYLDYGGLHFWSRMVSPPGAAGRAIDGLVCLGGIAPFSVVFLPLLWRERRGLVLVGTAVALAAAFPPAQLAPATDAAPGEVFFTIPFWLNGVLVSGATIYALLSRLLHPPANRSLDRTALTALLVWAAGSFAFAVWFGQFMAVRYLLPAIAAVTLVVAAIALPVCPRRVWVPALCLTIALGGLLSASDWSYADLHRRKARTIRDRLPRDARVVTVGHWGWQWYAEKAGMESYDRNSTELVPGDYVVAPTFIHQQVMWPEQAATLDPVDEIVVEAGPADWIRADGNRPNGGYYYSRGPLGPWRFSREPVQRFQIYRVSERARWYTRPLDLPVAIDRAAIASGTHPTYGNSSDLAVDLDGYLPGRFELEIESNECSAVSRAFAVDVAGTSTEATLAPGEAPTTIAIGPVAKTNRIDLRQAGGPLAAGDWTELARITLAQQPLELPYTIDLLQEPRDGESLEGFHGVWREKRWTRSPDARIALDGLLPERFRLRVNASTMPELVGHPVTIAIGGVERELRPSAEPQTFELEYDGVAPTNQIRIAGPRPLAPILFGRDDPRGLSVAVSSLTIEPANSGPAAAGSDGG